MPDGSVAREPRLDAAFCLVFVTAVLLTASMLALQVVITLTRPVPGPAVQDLLETLAGLTTMGVGGVLGLLGGRTVAG